MQCIEYNPYNNIFHCFTGLILSLCSESHRSKYNVVCQQLIKVDVETGDAKTWKESEYMYPGEVQFVPCPGSSSEDDGILLAAVTDVRKGEPDFLLVLDAKNLTEVARAEVTVHIPNVIHGLFLPSS